MKASFAHALGVLGLMLALAPGRASADTIVQFSPPVSNGTFGQCHNPHINCGGAYQIDFDGLGFDSGNPHGQLHINNVTIQISSLFHPPQIDGLHKVNGNVQQIVFPLSFTTANNATFRIGPNQVDITSITLTAVNPVIFRGTQIRPLDQDFLLTITTQHGQTFVFHMCSIMGSSVNFDRNGLLRDVNFRFCAGLVGAPPPPVVPEPTSLFALGAACLGLVSTIRRKLAA